MLAADMKVIAFDPYATNENDSGVQRASWPDRIEEADFIVVTSSLTPSSKHMLNDEIFEKVKDGVRVVNVGRGPVIKEVALEEALRTGKVYSAALDVFEIEPLPETSYLRTHPHCIFGSHNASNTADAVSKTSERAIDILSGFLGVA